MLTTNIHEVAHPANVRGRSHLVKHEIGSLFQKGCFERFEDDKEEIDPENTEDLMDDPDDDVSLSWTNAKRSQSIDRLQVISIDLSSTS